MPNGNPLVAEVWETTDPTGRNLRGIVADVTDAIITLVSFTGNRFRLSPARLVGSWHFFQSPPNTALHCTRRGCRSAGILRYLRGSSTTEWVCPKHLPVGVQATLTTESIGAPNQPPAEALATLAPTAEIPVRCTGCGNEDPVEDTRVAMPDRTALWVCGRCNERWCLISAGEHVAPLANVEQLMLDTLVEARVQLAVENYRIDEIVAAPSVYRVFERLTREAVPGPDPHMIRPVAYAGVPIRLVSDFLVQNPAGTLLRVHLRGGPEHRAPARIGPTPMPRQQAMNVGFEALYGGRPRSQAPPPVPVPYPVGAIHDPPYQDGRTEFTVRSTPDAGGLLDSMAPTPFVSQGTRWVNRSSGEVVEVAHLGRSTDSGDPVVHFKRVSDDMEVSLVLLQRDFENMFRPYTQDTPRIDSRVVEVLEGEEWEHNESHAVVRVHSVDTKRDLVIVVENLDQREKRRSIPMIDFVNAKWRKIVRRTAYDRLLELEDD